MHTNLILDRPDGLQPCKIRGARNWFWQALGIGPPSSWSPGTDDIYDGYGSSDRLFPCQDVNKNEDLILIKYQSRLKVNITYFVYVYPNGSLFGLQNDKIWTHLSHLWSICKNLFCNIFIYKYDILIYLNIQLSIQVWEINLLWCLTFYYQYTVYSENLMWIHCFRCTI